MKLDFSKFEFSDVSNGITHSGQNDMNMRKTIRSYSYELFDKIHDLINKMDSGNVVTIYKDIQERLKDICWFLFNQTHLDPEAKRYLTEIFINLKKLENEFSNKITQISDVE